MKTQLLAVALICSLSACYSTPEVKDTMESTQNVGEAIYGYKVAGDVLKVDVKSNGCTTFKSFELKSLGAMDYELVRTKPDLCKRMPYVATLEIPLPAGHADTVKLVNPVKDPASLMKSAKH